MNFQPFLIIAPPVSKMEIEDAKFNLEYDGEDFTIPLKGGQYTLRGCEWRPENEQPDFVVVFVHGLGTFLTLKHDLIDVVLMNNGAFIGCDHFGHGRSPGFRASCTIDEIVEETELVISKAYESFPDIPIFLFGMSMGGLASIKLVLTKSVFVSQHLRGVILESPWISNNEKAGISLLQSVMIMLAAKFSPYSIIDLGDEPYGKDCRQDFVKQAVESPLFSPFTTPRLLDSAFRSITYVRKRYNDWPSDLPVLFLQGLCDDAVDVNQSFEWAKDLTESSPKDIVFVRTYPNTSHNILKTPARASALTDVFEFINSHRQ